jgi:hypothetical protein
MLAYRPVDAAGPAPFKTPRRKTQRSENDYGAATRQFPKTPLPGKPLQRQYTRNTPCARATHIGCSLRCREPSVKACQETSLRPRQALGDKTPAANLRQITLNVLATRVNNSDLKPLRLSSTTPSHNPSPAPVPRGRASRHRDSQSRRPTLFKTPEPSGKAHWDVSDIDMSIEQESAVEECYDEPDYMPPTAISKLSNGSTIIIV